MTVPSGTWSVWLHAHGLVLAGSKGAHRLDGRHALGGQQGPELAVDGRDALHPGRALLLGRHVLEGSHEVIRYAEDLAQQALAGEAQLPEAVLLRAPLVVGEVGRGPLPLPADALRLGLGGLGPSLPFE